MSKRLLAIGLCLILVTVPVLCRGNSEEAQRSAEWSARLHEENSLMASILWIPSMILSLPIKLIGGIRNPKPASQSVIPPAAHRPGH